MSKYTVVLTSKAKRQLDKFPDDVVNAIIKTLESLETNPRPLGCKKLKGREGYRIRTGNYRIIYDIIDEVLIIEIIAIGHRKEIYR
mgnify:CR=1 FL=1|jgi:mRNA interferase RelE/StbE